MRFSAFGAVFGLTLAGTLLAPTSAPGNSGRLEAAAGAMTASGQAAAHERGPLQAGPGERLELVEKTAGGRPGRPLLHSVYERTYQGLPVRGGGVVAVTDAAGRVLHAAGGGPLVSPPSTEPTVRATAARRAALGAVQGSATTTLTTSAPSLAILADDGAARLVWEVAVESAPDESAVAPPDRRHVLVDAVTGTVVRSSSDVRAGTGVGYYSGEVAIGTTAEGDGFAMSDPERPGLRCGGIDGETFTGPDDQWGNGSGTDLETACVDAMYAAQVQADALRDWMNYDGISGDGRYFGLRVGLNEVNAFWTGEFALFGHSQDGRRQATAPDIVGHELGHGVFQFAGIDGAGGGVEQSGMNESTGDILGTITEAYAAHPSDPPDYVIGERTGLVEPDEPIRALYDPSRYGHPNCYPELDAGTEVHAGAGPQNHWFYLVTEGSDPDNGMPASPICPGGPDRVTGIGIQKAAQIFLEALQTKDPFTWDHRVARAETLAAAVRLFPGSCAEFDTVRDAWDAIGVPAGPDETC